MASQGFAADTFQRPLRSRFQARLKPERSPGREASGRTRQLSRELLPAATRRENQELKTDAPSGHGLAAALGGWSVDLNTMDRGARAEPRTAICPVRGPSLHVRMAPRTLAAPRRRFRMELG
jgi:hypothetical protein